MIKDIYFSKEYAALNEIIEDGNAEFFEVKNVNGHITYSFIRRKIAEDIDGESFFDIITPYGYGGPVVHEAKDMNKLMKDYGVVFEKFCATNNIVSEFVRFHPIFKNQDFFKDIYEINYLRNTIGTNLKKFDDTFQSEFSRTARTKIRKRLRDERISYSVNEGFEQIDDFIKIYRATMKRHKATDFYYFDDEYFYELKREMSVHLLTISVYYDEKVIAMGLYFLSDDIIHDHLNGTLPEYLSFSPAYLLKYASMQWGIENNYSLIHYGGGVTNSEDDPVLHFKKRFGKHTEFKYHIGKKIWNESVYKKLCERTDVESSNEFFPAYRAGNIKSTVIH